MTFRPTFWATVAALAGLVVLIGLGSWQLDRRVWKEQLIATLGERVSAPQVTLKELLAEPGFHIMNTQFRPIRVRGRFRTDDSIKLLSRTRGGRAGFHLITPLVVEAPERIVLIDRGWVPIGGEESMTPAPKGLVDVEGFIRFFETQNRFTPDNDPETGTWFYLDFLQIMLALEAENLMVYYIQAVPNTADPGAYPQGSVPDVALRNPHLQYAMTWYALAVVLLVIYVIFHLRRRAGEDE